jgi:hypothetical protein
VTITSANLIVLPGQTQPSKLRVTGQAQQCVGNQVVVTSSITAGSGPVTVNLDGRFRVELPITATPVPSCGATVSVRAECATDANCFDQRINAPLACCEVPTLYFQAVRPVTSLTPTHLLVQGVLCGCPTDQVVIASPVTATTAPIAVDLYTGEFSAQIPLTSVVQCGDKIGVTASCATPGGCSGHVEMALDCPGCYAAQVTVTGAPCTGTPPVQPVTLAAEVSIPAGSTHVFFWEFGDGSVGPHFTINNSAGNAASHYPHTETHDYVPGTTYTAWLRIVPPPSECLEVSVQVVATCGTPGCPTITPPMATVGPCVNNMRTVTFTSSVTAGPAGAIVYWDFGGGAFSAPSIVTANATLALSPTHDYAPGSYTATLKTLQPTGCPDQPVTFVVGTCGDPPCTLHIQSIQTQVGPCDPATGTRRVTATAVLTNSDPADRYYWQWDGTPATVGLAAPAGVTQFHDYASPGSGTNTETVELVVIRSTGCVASLGTTVTFDGCGSGCPEIVKLQTDAPGVCTPDRSRRTVSLDATINGTGVTQYVWQFGDGTTLTLPGSGGPHTTHDYLPGTYTVRLTISAPGDCSSHIDLTITIDPCCPVITGLVATPGACVKGVATRPVTLTATVSGSAPATYVWNFGDGSPTVSTTTPVAPVHQYAGGGPFTATVNASSPTCGASSARTSISVTGCGGGDISCAILLWIAMICMAIGGLLVVIGCILTKAYPLAGLILMIIGAALTLIGWLLFGLWLWLCSSTTACAVIMAVRSFVIAMIALFAVIAVVLAILALFGQVDLWPCSGAAAAYGANWGVVLSILDGVAFRLGCITVGPAGGKGGSGSSSSPLMSNSTRLDGGYQAPPSMMMSVTEPVQRAKMTGLGDLVKATTTLMGIQPCTGCQERARRLNAMVPFGD